MDRMRGWKEDLDLFSRRLGFVMLIIGILFIPVIIYHETVVEQRIIGFVIEFALIYLLFYRSNILEHGDRK